MKTILAVLLTLGSFNAVAGSPAVDCLRAAYSEIGDGNLAGRVCWGATSNAPLECWKAAYRIIGDGNLSAWLCTGATSNEPVACMTEAYSANGGDYAQAVLFCRGQN